MKGRADKMPGLPREALFGHLAEVPRVVTRFYLEENVWWWRKDSAPIDRWVAEMADGWPNCELFRDIQSKNPSADLSKLPQMAAEERVKQILITRVDFYQHRVAQWWDQHRAMAKAYEWEARKTGAYPCGKSFDRLTAIQRAQWGETHWRLNMDAIPHVAEDGDEWGAMTPHGWSRRFCFNLAGNDGYIIKEFRGHLGYERQRLRKPNPPRPNQHHRAEADSPLVSAEEFDSARTVALDLGAATVWTRWFRFNLDGRDPRIIEELEGHLAHERARLKCPNPQTNQNRVPLKSKYSWADVECVDVAKFCRSESTSDRERQRKSVSRRRLG